MEERSIKEFTDLIAWQEGHQLVLNLYRQTSSLPHSEKYGLAGQLQRAAISITSNIAEGFSRRSYKDKLHFMYIALGSSKEIQNQLLVCRDLNYLSIETYNTLAEQNAVVNKLLYGIIKSFSQKINRNVSSVSMSQSPNA